MATPHPSSLDAAALSCRLGELAGDERALQVEFLLRLDEYDRRPADLEAGFGALWEYLTRALHHREGAAYRRMKAMNALRRVAPLADALRDGRLSLTTLALLEPTSPRPRLSLPRLSPRPSAGRRSPRWLRTWSLHVTIDGDLRREVEELKALLSHEIPNGDLEAVLREAVRCAIEKHGRRKGALDPAEAKAAAMERAATSRGRQEPTAEVRRQVWRRDEGCCAWTAPDGRRCGSRWRLEVHHVEAAALGGPATVATLELRCRSHNGLDAERTFGRAHMERFRRESRTGESTSPGGSGPAAHVRAVRVDRDDGCAP